MDKGILAAIAGGVVLIGLGAAAIVPRMGAQREITIGGPFRLTEGDGRVVTDADFRGKWQLIYFGYTHCPDACPTTLSNIGAALGKMPAALSAKVAVLFITVDPQRDTPAVIGAYAKAFGPEFVGLTGSQQVLAPVEASFRVYAQRHELKGGDYEMDHSSIIYVMAPDGRFAGLLDDGMSSSELAAKLTKLGQDSAGLKG